MKRRLLSIVLVVAMILSMVPAVFAETAENYAEIVGGNQYETLAEAVADAEAGATIKLLKDFTGAGLVFDKSITIDLGGHTYTLNKSVGSSAQYSTNGFYIWGGNTVTVKNGTINMVADEMGDDVTFFKLFMNYGTLTLTDVVLDCANGVAYNGDTDVGFLTVEGHGPVTVDGETSIINSELSTETWTIAAVDTDVTIDTTGTIEGVVYAYGTSANIAIENGNFTIDEEVYGEKYGLLGGNGTIEVTGGTFSQDVSGYVHPDYNFAAGSGSVIAPENVKSYVSLGDSMTNGYGLPGYDRNSGVEDYGDGSYANLFAQWLGADHAQLAMSAMRAEDLHWLLELDYSDWNTVIAQTEGAWDEAGWNAAFTNGDYWTWDEICTHSRTRATTDMILATGYDAYPEGYDVDDPYTGDVALIAKYFQEKVSGADVISLGMGNGNFGVFMFGRLLEAIGFDGTPSDAMVYDIERALAECDPELKAQVLELKDTLYAAIEEHVGTSIESNPTLEALANTVVYTGISYVVNYAGSVEAILQKNNDAEIILVALMNTYQDDAEIEGITIGDLLDAVFTPLNAYIAALPTYMQAAGNSVYADATFYYAEADKVECLVDVYGDDFDQGTDSIIRDRFVQSIILDEDNKPGMVWDLLSDVELVDGVKLTNVTLEEIVDYDNMGDVGKAAYAKENTQKAVSIAVYLAFEKAIIASKEAPVTVDSVLGLGGLSADMFGTVMDDFMANVGTDGAAYLDTAAALVAEGSEGQLSADAVKALVVNGVDNTAYQMVATQVGNGATAESIKAAYESGDETAVAAVNSAKAQLQLAYDSANQLWMLLAMPETLSKSLQKDVTVSGLLALFARCVIGNGLGGHPSAAGHVALYEAVKASYDNKYTAADKTEDNLIAVKDLIAEYYDEAYAYAYDYADENGYIKAAADAIDGVIADLAAIDVSGTEMTEEFKAEVAGEIEEIIETLTAAKALIAEADELDPATYEALMAALDEAGEAIENLLDVLAQAGMDVNDLVVVPALNAAYDKLVNEVIPAIITDLENAVQAGTDWLMEKMGEAYNELVDWIIETVEEAAPEAADWVYDWLYNNPDKVIAFFNEYGDDMVAFLNEYKEEIAVVLGYLAANYGEDVVQFVMDNADEILKTMVDWYNEHGENTWALIEVYLDELGVIDAVNGAISDVQGALNGVLELLDKYAPEVKAALENLSQEALNNLKNAADELLKLVQNELNNFVNEVKPELEAAIKELQAELDALKQELADKKAELEGAVGDAKAELEEAIKELEQKIDEIEAAIAELEAQLAQIPEKLETLKEAALELNAAIEKAIAEGIDAAAAEIQAALNKVLDAIEDVIGVVSDSAAAELNQIVETVKAALNEAYIDATTAEYEIDENSYYVAIGDDTAVSVSYVDALAEELAALAATEDYEFLYKNLAQAGMTLDETYELLQTNAEDIAKADLITIGFGNNGFTDFTVANLNAAIMGEEVEMDWSLYVTEDGVHYVDEALVDVYNKLAQSGIEGQYMGMDITELLTLAIESYAYSYISYACNLPEVVNAINAVNDDALVLVVGMHNPMDDVVLTLDEENTIALGDYLQYLVDAVNVHATAYAMLTGDVTYVAAPAVETGVALDEMTAVQFLMYYLNATNRAQLNPTEAGHAYITEQILNAVDVTVKEALWDVSFANMTLSSSLAMNFAFKQEHETDWTGYYAEIVKTYADGRDDVVVNIPAAEWGQAGINGEAYYTIGFNGIAAKEMTDDVYVTIYNADGVAKSNVWTDTVRDYATRALNDSESTVDELIMMVDMLNYGAAAQQLFNYNTGDLANANLTEVQKAMATKSVDAADSRVKGDNYMASSLTLESKILLNMAFSGVTEGMTAEVSFTDHYGKEKCEDVTVRIVDGVGVLDIDQIAVADGRVQLKVTVYNADGSVYGTAEDSVESYIARAGDAETENAELYEMILKFADSAYNFFH